MSRNESLIVAYLLDGKGGGKKVGWSEVEAWTPEQGLLWVHLNYASKRSAQWLSKSSGLDKISVRAMLMEESRPRSVLSPNGILIFLRGINHNPGEDPEDMVSIRTWINGHLIVTTRKRRLLSVIDIEQAISDGCGPTTSAEFLRMLNNCLLDRMSDVINSVDDRVDELEQEVIEAKSHLIRPKLADVRRQSIELRRYLAPQREALRRLYHEESPWLSTEDKLHFREANDRVVRYIEDLDSARERASVTQEELSSRLSEQMDKRMYVLSVVAVIFLPLSFLTGLLGINVGGIPGVNDPWAFTWVCGGLFGLFFMMLLFFRWRRWM